MTNEATGMRRQVRRAAFSLMLTLPLAAAPATAQWSPTWVGVAETSGDDVTLLLASASVSPAGLGLKPVVGVSTYWLNTQGGSTWGATPSAGLIMRGETGALQGRVGYSFRDNPDDDDIVIFGGDEAGVMTSAQADYWDGGAFGLQGIAAFNWGSEYLWSRARATVRVAELDFGGGIHVGPEFVYQGEMGEETVTDPHYSSIQFGPVVQWNSGNRLIAAVGAGWKQFNTGGPAAEDESTWYAKVEFVLH